MKLEKTYLSQLDQFVDELGQTGMVEIPYWWLYAAFDMDRITKSVWAAIEDHYAERFELTRDDTAENLKVVRPRKSGSVFFIYSDDDCPIIDIGSLNGGD